MARKIEKKELKDHRSLLRKIVENPALIVIIVITFLVVSLFGTYAYIYAAKNVYAYVDGMPVYQYEMSNEIIDQAIKNNVDLGSIGTDPKGAFAKYTLTEFAKRAIFSRKLYYIIAIKDGFTCTKNELDKAFYDFKKQNLSGTANPEEEFKKILDMRGITEKQLRTVLREEVIAQKEKDKLTANITVSPEEVQKYFDEWSYAYVKGGQDKGQVFKEQYARIKSDALDMKKQDYLRKYTNNLMEKDKNNIVIDNRYKKFMRWAYSSLLNLAVPPQFKPGTV